MASTDESKKDKKVKPPGPNQAKAGDPHPANDDKLIRKCGPPTKSTKKEAPKAFMNDEKHPTDARTGAAWEPDIH